MRASVVLMLWCVAAPAYMYGEGSDRHAKQKLSRLGLRKVVKTVNHPTLNTPSALAASILGFDIARKISSLCVALCCLSNVSLLTIKAH